jgi:hypothetical protein
MNLDSLSFALSQINYLITNLNKKNFKTSQVEILQVSYKEIEIFHWSFVNVEKLMLFFSEAFFWILEIRKWENDPI